MAGLALLVLQAAAGPPAPVPVRAPTLDRACPRPDDGDEVVVCARRNDTYRLRPLPERYQRDRSLPRAELRVFGGAKLGVEAEQGADAQGGAINRAMVRLKIPLGGRRKER